MEKEKLTLEDVKRLFFNHLAEFKEANPEITKRYSFTRATLDSALQKEFPDASQTDRTNQITAFLKNEGMNIQKISHGNYEYVSEEYLTQYLIFNTIAEAKGKIANAKINMDENTDGQELKKLCVLAAEAEKKLIAVFKELLEMAPEFESTYKSHMEMLEMISDE